MNIMKNPLIYLVVAGLAAGIIAARWISRQPEGHTAAAIAETLKKTKQLMAGGSGPALGSAEAVTDAIQADEEAFQKGLLPNFPEFQLRPFAVVKSSATHEWTGENGLTDAAIRALAHNPVEEESLKKQNEWTTRRQLVYRKETVSQILAELQSGIRKQITVPGFDGKEYVVNVQKIQVFDEVDTFSILGTLQDNPQINFSLGSTTEGHESMNYSDPVSGKPLVYTSREAGQGVLSQIDPEEMSKHSAPMGEPILNDDVGQH
jgi:hypothetical protein